jgi:hypothetical protein
VTSNWQVALRRAAVAAPTNTQHVRWVFAQLCVLPHMPDLHTAYDVAPCRPQVCHHHNKVSSLHHAPLAHQVERVAHILLQGTVDNSAHGV